MQIRKAGQQNKIENKYGKKKRNHVAKKKKN